MLGALLPIFAIILLGWALRRLGFPAAGFWPQAERITYYLFLPALFVGSLAVADFGSLAAGRLALALALPIVVMSAGLLLARPHLPVSGPTFTSLFQGAVRMNTYVGLSAAAALFGTAGVTMSSVAIVAMIPLINVLCVSVITMYGARGGRPGGRVLLEIVRNPLIVGCAVGYALNASGLVLPPAAVEFFRILGRAALPIGLLAAGTGLRFGAVGHDLRALALATSAKLVGLPLLTAAACELLGVAGDERTIALVFAALPTSAASYILARQLGGDVPAMASIITVQHLAAALTMPAMVAWLG
ncbi:MAG: AEC family transporter [Candidatus Krumholzibacteriia bacterium]